MSVITISRQVASLGTEIARELAKRLNFEYADKEMIGKILADYGLPETEMEKFDEKKPPFWDSLSIQRKNFLHLIQAAIYDLSRTNRVVIVGRGGQVLLQDLPGTVHVRIFAPFGVRVKRLMQSEGGDEKHAARIIRQSDHDSSGYILSLFNVNWEDPSLYNLIINTQTVSITTAVELIVELNQSPEIQEGAEKAAKKLADLSLVRKVEAELLSILGADIRHVDIRADGGSIILKGAVTSLANKESCERAAAALEGVKRVENQLSITPYYRFGP